MSSANAKGRSLLSSTPIDVHRCCGRSVFVKREDLCTTPPAPPLGKLRGLEPVVRRLVSDGARTIGCWDTRVSKLGLGLAVVACQFHGVKAVVCYPRLKNGGVPVSIERASELGAEVVAMRGNHPSICFAQANRILARKGGVMIPFGLECRESVAAIAAEAARVPARLLKNGTVVLSCGSGVTLAGLLEGLRPCPQRFVGVSAGRSLAKLEQCIRRYHGVIPSNVTLVPASMRYDSVPSQQCPFPSHPNYDLKAWAYLVDNLDSLQSPLLFWNIGA